MSGSPADAGWTRVCALAQLIPERGVPALVGDQPVAIFLLEDGSLRAIGHHDPFSNANVMARGIVGSMGEDEDYRDTVASPMYKQVFDLATGECLSEPGTRLPVWPVRVVEGQVEVGSTPLPVSSNAAGAPAASGATP